MEFDIQRLSGKVKKEKFISVNFSSIIIE